MRRTDDYMMTEEEVRQRARKRRIRLLLIIVLVLVIAGGFFTAKPAVHAIKAFQARRHAQKAFALIEQEKWSEARDEAIAAYQLYPKEPEALRAVARFLTRVRNPQALDFWKQLQNATPLRRQDFREEATIALISGERELAAIAIDHLIANDGKNAAPADWLLAAQLGLQKSAPQETESALRKVFDDSKTNEAEMLRAALLELQATNLSQPEIAERHQTDAWSRITKIAQGKSSTALDALMLLAQRALSSSPITINNQQLTSSDLARAIENHPLAKAPQKLLALDLQMHADPSQKEACIERAIAQWKDDVSSLPVLATWLNGHGEYRRELETIPLEKARQMRELFLQHLDALGALGRWSEIKQLLNSEGFPLEPVIQQMYLARCTTQLGEKAAAENNWKRALEAAADDAQKLIQLGEFAEKNGELAIAKAAYDSTAAQTPKLRVAQQGRLRIAQAQRDTKKIHAVLAEMLQLWPNDTAIQNDEAYTRLLLLPDDPSVLGELITIEHIAEGLVKREPSSLPHRTLLALVRLKQHRPVAALDAYANIQAMPNALSPSALAVHAAVLAANDRRDDARSEIRQAPLDKLLPEEQAWTADLRD
jgi:hypothetical protein